jgi:hypothetical protein
MQGLDFAAGEVFRTRTRRSVLVPLDCEPPPLGPIEADLDGVSALVGGGARVGVRGT